MSRSALGLGLILDVKSDHLNISDVKADHLNSYQTEVCCKNSFHWSTVQDDAKC